MTGRLATDVVAVLAHVLEHVAVADRRARKPNPHARKMAFKAEIRHHGGHDARLAEPAVLLEALGSHRQQLVAIDEMAAFVDDNHAIGITVERDADDGPPSPRF